MPNGDSVVSVLRFTIKKFITIQILLAFLRDHYEMEKKKIRGVISNSLFFNKNIFILLSRELLFVAATFL